MAAVLYDESLDQFKAHQWQQAFGCSQDHNSLNQQFVNIRKDLPAPAGPMESPGLQKHLHELPAIPGEITANLYGYGYYSARNRTFAAGRGGLEMAAAPTMMRSAKMAAEGMAQSAPMAMNASQLKAMDDASADIGASADLLKSGEKLNDRQAGGGGAAGSQRTGSLECNRP